MPFKSKLSHRTAIFLFALLPLCAAPALDFEVGGSASVFDGILLGPYTDTIIENNSGYNAVSVSPVLSPLIGFAVTGNIFFSPMLGAGASLIVHTQGGAVTVRDAAGTIVAASGLEEINITLAFRFLQKVRLPAGSLIFSEGLTMGLVPSEIVHVQSVGTSITKISVMPLEYYYASNYTAGSPDYALMAYGIELRAGYGYPAGPGRFEGSLVFRAARIPTGFSQESGDAFIFAPGLEIGYILETGKIHAEKK